MKTNHLKTGIGLIPETSRILSIPEDSRHLGVTIFSPVDFMTYSKTTHYYYFFSDTRDANVFTVYSKLLAPRLFWNKRYLYCRVPLIVHGLQHEDTYLHVGVQSAGTEM
jgi:hypothetical protein